MSDSASTSSRVRRAYEDFLSGITPADDSVRSVVRDSWARSIQRGVDPGDVVPESDTTSMSATEFAEYRDAHPITAVRPLVQSLMLDDIADSGVVVALTDQAGRLLWVEGATDARDRAADINFVEGSMWSEEIVGTNAPGLALAVDRGVQVVGPEHFAGAVQEWSCAAAPVHDPITGHVIGVIDVTGGREVAAPFALAAVRSVVAAVERELHSRAVDLADPSTFVAESGARLTVLGGSYRWRRAGDGSPERALSRRHAEILLLLQAYPEGLNTEQLAVMLAEDGVDPVTVRAEISRLRRDLGADVVESRPYRLTVALVSDVSEIRDRVAGGGDLSAVIEVLGRGGLLAESSAPGVAEVFEELREDLRSRIIAEGDVGALRKWTSSAHGRDDLAAWRRLERRLPPGHPDRPVVGGRIRLLDKRYGV
ncbi:transcriptional regulator [Gordonia sp. ABSL11-1]|uniref:GAF domain-containing protein n=1 Tax=Gordonia sp. ABSL11-1 TaxID=3053924 RepID=UPI002573E2CF|nr:GAF domain-containing protein [Gordonia sp. ABSL11-1]MDL9946979.1 transcriptional regulator [Gordonia sp. ABSL11-1]